MKILLSPHNDDEALFASFTILREKPIVIIVTDGYAHQERFGLPIGQRRSESIEAMKVLGAEIMFLGISDIELTHDGLNEELKKLNPEKVYAPAIMVNGNCQHNIVGIVAKQLWGDKVTFYSTYTIDDLTPRGNIEIKPTEEEMRLKNEALSKYKSQLRLNKAHFDAVRDKSEYYV